MSTIGKRFRALARPRRGQAIIETALVLPILILLVFGIVNVSMYMFDYLQATNCVRDAARRAAVHAAAPTCEVADVALTESEVDGVLVVTAAVDTTHEWLIPFPPMTDPAPLNVSVVMRMEGEPL